MYSFFNKKGEKRPADSSGDSSSKKYSLFQEGEEEPMDTNGREARSVADGTGGSSKGIGLNQQSIDSARRYIRYASGHHTLTFFKTSFSIIDTELTGIPLQHSLSSFFTTNDVKRLTAFFNSNKGFHFINIKVYDTIVKNPIVLSDQITVSNTGVNEVSSFVQSCKIIRICIDASKNYHENMYLLSVDPLASANQRLKDVVVKDHLKFKGSSTSALDSTPLLSFPIEAMQANMRSSKDYDCFSKLKGSDDYNFNDIIYQPIQSFPSLKVTQLFIRQRKGPSYDNLTDKFLPQGYYLARDNPSDYIINVLPFEALVKSELLQSPLLKTHPYEHMDPQDQFFCKSSSPPIAISSGFKFMNQLKDAYVSIANSSGNTVRSPCILTYPSRLNENVTPFDFDEASITQRAYLSKGYHTHDYFTMTPILSSDNKIMKIRASVTVEQRVDISFYSSEFDAFSTDSVDNMQSQLPKVQYNFNAREIDSKTGYALFTR